MSPITRSNYEDYCSEPPLSPEELKEWRQMCGEMVAGINENDLSLRMFVRNRTLGEYDKNQTAYHSHTKDWSDMILVHDTCVILKRAEIAAYRVWRAKCQ